MILIQVRPAHYNSPSAGTVVHMCSETARRVCLMASFFPLLVSSHLPCLPHISDPPWKRLKPLTSCTISMVHDGDHQSVEEMSAMYNILTSCAYDKRRTWSACMCHTHCCACSHPKVGRRRSGLTKPTEKARAGKKTWMDKTDRIKPLLARCNRSIVGTGWVDCSSH